MRLSLICILLLTLMACRSKAADEDLIFLELQVAPGDVFVTEMEMQQELKLSLQGRQTFVEQYFKFLLNTEIIPSEDDKTYKAENIYKRITMQQRMEQEEEEVIYYIDTQNPDAAEIPDKQLLKYYINLTQLPYFTILDRQGNILSDNISDVNTAAGGAAYASSFRQMFTYSVVYPGYALKVGDSWTKDLSFRDSTVSVTANLQYTLEAVDEEKALIGFNGQIKSVQKGMNAGGKTEMIQQGKVWVYLASGWIKEAELDQEIKMNDPEGGSKPRYIQGKVKIRDKSGK